MSDHDERVEVVLGAIWADDPRRASATPIAERVLAALDAHDRKQREGDGLPDDLRTLLEDPGVVIRQDAAVFELLAKWQRAKATTASESTNIQAGPDSSKDLELSEEERERVHAAFRVAGISTSYDRMDQVGSVILAFARKEGEEKVRERAGAWVQRAEELEAENVRLRERVAELEALLRRALEVWAGPDGEPFRVEIESLLAAEPPVSEEQATRADRPPSDDPGALHALRERNARQTHTRRQLDLECVDDWMSRCKALRERVAELEKALRYYAEDRAYRPETALMEDKGAVARKALAAEPSVSEEQPAPIEPPAPHACPECGRKAAMVRTPDDPQMRAYCRWCGFYRPRTAQQEGQQ